MESLNELMLTVLDRLAHGEDFNRVIEDTGITARVADACREEKKGPFTVTLNCKGLLAYRDDFAHYADALKTAERFACPKGTRIRIAVPSTAILYERT